MFGIWLKGTIPHTINIEKMGLTELAKYIHIFSITGDVRTVAKLEGCKELRPWTESIRRQLWYCFRNCRVDGVGKIYMNRLIYEIH